MGKLDNLLAKLGNRKWTLFLLALGYISLIGATLVGISDNPPGIGLCYIGIGALILVFVHHWRKVKLFLWLLLASTIGFPVFAILHNVFYALGKATEKVVILKGFFNVLDVLGFLIAILVCPPGILIGAVGSIVLYLNNKRK